MNVFRNYHSIYNFCIARQVCLHSKVSVTTHPLGVSRGDPVDTTAQHESPFYIDEDF